MSLHYLHLSPAQQPPELALPPFRTVIVAEAVADQSWRNRVAEWLLDGGCLYVVAWGVDCETWHDTVDWTSLEASNFEDIPDDRFVMTTWHANEPLAEAFWFAGFCANHGDVELEATLILHISEQPAEAAMLEAFRESQSLADEA